MKFCPKCQRTYDDSANICGACGSPLAVIPNAVPVTDHTADFDKADISQNKVFAMLPYLLGIFGIIISLLASKESAYTGFHVRQALKLTVCNTLLGIITTILSWTIIVPIAGVVCMGIIFVLNIIAFFQVCGGKAKEPAIISGLKFLK